MTHLTEAPIFDADQHMYEMGESLTKHLPEMYSRAVQFAQFGKQTRIVVNNRVSPFWEGCVADVVDTVGRDRVLFGSDYPHPEGLAETQGLLEVRRGHGRAPNL